jgi:mannose-6-phosphate isomerase-like protein (cupin superfamily)
MSARHRRPEVARRGCVPLGRQLASGHTIPASAIRGDTSMSTNEKSKRRRGLSIFRAKDAVDLTVGDFMTPVEMTDETRTAFGDQLASGLGSGGQTKVLLRQTEDEGGFSLVHLWFKPGYPLVRHSHDVDCLYYVLSGSAIMGNQVLRPGDGFFVPADAPYQYDAGPDGVEVLEVRHGVHQFNMVIPDQSDEAWQSMLHATVEHRDEWAQAVEGPTFAANRTP